MFLCANCHVASGCKWPTMLEIASMGRCEHCERIAPCTDCHGYDFRTPQEPK